MKRYWIAALLVLTMIALLLTGCGGKKQKEAEDAPAQPQVQEDPDTLVCNNGKTTLRFHKEDDKWCWVDDVDFPLDQSYVQQLMDTLYSLRDLTALGKHDEMSAYGLEDAKAYIMLGDPSGEESYIYLGNATDGGNYMYDGNEENGLYIAPATLMEQISRSIYDMALLPTLPQLTMDNMTAFDLVTSKKELHLTAKGGAWYSENTDVTRKMSAATDALTKLTLSACVDYRPASGAAEICGLGKDAAVLTVSYGDSMTFTMKLGTKRDKSGYYVTVNDDTTIYLLSAELGDTLKTLATDGI